jgi:hypothetical protein
MKGIVGVGWGSGEGRMWRFEECHTAPRLRWGPAVCVLSHVRRLAKALL